MDEWLCSSTHNKDNVEALNKCAPLARFISFVPHSIYLFIFDFDFDLCMIFTLICLTFMLLFMLLQA